MNIKENVSKSQISKEISLQGLSLLFLFLNQTDLKGSTRTQLCCSENDGFIFSVENEGYIPISKKGFIYWKEGTSGGCSI